MRSENIIKIKGLLLNHSSHIVIEEYDGDVMLLEDNMDEDVMVGIRITDTCDLTEWLKDYIDDTTEKIKINLVVLDELEHVLSQNKIRGKWYEKVSNVNNTVNLINGEYESDFYKTFLTLVKESIGDEEYNQIPVYAEIHIIYEEVIK